MQGETGVDCGGPCKACPSCSDGKKNQVSIHASYEHPCMLRMLRCVFQKQHWLLLLVIQTKGLQAELHAWFCISFLQMPAADCIMSSLAPMPCRCIIRQFESRVWCITEPVFSDLGFTLQGYSDQRYAWLSTRHFRHQGRVSNHHNMLCCQFWWGQV